MAELTKSEQAVVKQVSMQVFQSMSIIMVACRGIAVEHADALVEDMKRDEIKLTIDPRFPPEQLAMMRKNRRIAEAFRDFRRKLHSIDTDDVVEARIIPAAV